MFSENLFLRTPLDGCFWRFPFDLTCQRNCKIRLKTLLTSNEKHNTIQNIMIKKLLMCLPKILIFYIHIYIYIYWDTARTARIDQKLIYVTKYLGMDEVKFFKAVLQNFFLIRSWIICPISFWKKEKKI